MILGLSSLKLTANANEKQCLEDEMPFLNGFGLVQGAIFVSFREGTWIIGSLAMDVTIYFDDTLFIE